MRSTEISMYDKNWQQYRKIEHRTSTGKNEMIFDF